jgi:hypothetical protein
VCYWVVLEISALKQRLLYDKVQNVSVRSRQSPRRTHDCVHGITRVNEMPQFHIEGNIKNMQNSYNLAVFINCNNSL